MSALIEQTFASLPDRASDGTVRQLAELIDSIFRASSRFLSCCCQQLCQLYKVSCCGCLDEKHRELHLASDIEWTLLSTIAQQKAMSRLVQIVWQQKQPTLARTRKARQQ
ncbi:MAG: hypothetical protein U0930_06550 [Pirellulales bacterium]